jgi:NAD(P)-dependent dehydrogenase (short-subunit alcohol dehydrogenase family)
MRSFVCVQRGDMLDFKGKRIVITGAAGGVGRALCARFSELGGMVVALDIDAAALAPLAAAERIPVDLTDIAAMEAAIDALAEEPIDVVLANLGWTRAETLEQLSDESLLGEVDINLLAAMRLSRRILPAVRRARGNFVFVSSVNARAHYGNPAYSAAKAGVEAWARAIATEEGRNGVRANVVVPASIRTAAWDHRAEKDPDIFKAVAKLYPLGRLVEPVEVANAAAFLASPLASGITGTLLAVDCGLTGSNMGFLDAIAPRASETL